VGFETQWREVQARLPENWGEARLQITIPERDQLERAAALLAPASPTRDGMALRFYAGRNGAGPSAEAVRRLFRRLDDARIFGWLELLASGEAKPSPKTTRGSVRDAWDAAVDALPDDWSDLYGELELRSTDHHEPAALVLSPLNPAHYGGKPGFRFRVARTSGYGASAGMARRCFQRLDEAEIPGELRVLRVLCDTDNVATQGPVWYIDGRPV
jgi:hypothetical protein